MTTHVVLTDHPFEPKPFTDITQRGQRSCARCQKVPEVHPVSPHRDRDIADERSIKQYAADLYPGNTISVGRYIAHAEGRAHDGPVRDADTRDFDTDGLEEASDWTNYLAWRIQQLDRMAPEKSAKRLAYCHALVKVFEAWEAVEIAQHEDD